MGHRLKIALIAGTVTGVLAAGGVAIAGATGGDDDATDQAITGSALDHASAVALDHTGGGRVTGTEVRDEEGYYEVEVETAGGRSVDVHLDRDFEVIGGKGDGAEDSQDGGSSEK
jgi:uncharacterized membrane protein YkoI